MVQSTITKRGMTSSGFITFSNLDHGESDELVAKFEDLEREQVASVPEFSRWRDPSCYCWPKPNRVLVVLVVQFHDLEGVKELISRAQSSKNAVEVNK